MDVGVLLRPVSEDRRQQLIASSWAVKVAARLLINLVLPLSEAKERDLCLCAE